jgi:hypothetical protein
MPQALLLILVGALLNTALIFSMVASLASEGRDATVATAPRWIVPLLAGLLVAVLLPLERALGRDTAPKLRAFTPFLRGFTPFIVGSTLALSLVVVALGLNFLGLPVVDVYLASAFSVVLLLFWAWRYRTLFAGPIPSQMSRRYSLVLILVAAWHSLWLAVRLLARGVVTETDLQAAVSWYTAALFTIVSIACLLVAQLRRSRSAYSLPATTALSVWLAFDLPFGTAAFLYWLLRVRKHDAAEPAA